MCLGIPMQVVAIDGYVARCTAKGVERDVSLFLLQDDRPDVGDFVVVHVGYAIQKTTPAQAQSAWELYDVSTDRSETRNVAHERPDKVAEMAAIWEMRLAEFTALARQDLPKASS